MGGPPMTGMRTAMGTAMGGGTAGYGGVRDGKATEQIYSLIKEGKYHDAISILTSKQLEFPSSRAAESLLGLCVGRAMRVARRSLTLLGGALVVWSRVWRGATSRLGVESGLLSKTALSDR